MKQQLKPIAQAMSAILADPRASRIERIECAKVLLSCHGQFIPDVDEKWLSVRQLTQLRMLKQEVAERILRRKAARKRQNKSAFLRRKIRVLKVKQAQEKKNGLSTAN